MKAPKPTRTVDLFVDAEALAHNWQALNRLSGKAVAGAAVKADCYGLGVHTCVPILRDAGCENFFVAHWSEVDAVAQHVSAHQISVLHGPMTQSDCDFAKYSGAIPVINSIEQAKLWIENSGGLCDLMVDTGINRLGISLSELEHDAIKALNVRTLMSHLACADEDGPMNSQQLTRFESVLDYIPHQMASLPNSAGIALGPDYAFDLTRPGLALYGGIPRSELADHIKQVAFPQAAVMQVRDITAGESVGYNAAFVAERDMRIATVSLGYADGFLRAWGVSGAALLRDNRALSVLGKVSMDMVVVDCTNMPDLAAGDWLTVPYSLPNAAQQTSLSQYELLTVLGQRMKL